MGLGMSSARIASLVPVMIVLVAAPVAASSRSAPRNASSFTLSSAATIGSRWGSVTSTTRTPQHNYRVGGARNSFHLTGRAIDIARRPGVRHADIEASYRNAGFVLIESLDEGDHSHFAFGGFRPTLAIAARAEPRQAARVVASACRASATNDDASLSRRRPDRNDSCAPSEELTEAQSALAADTAGLE